MRTIKIPGGTAALREKHEIKVRHKRLIESATIGAAVAMAKLPSDQAELEAASLADLELTSAEADGLFALQDATIIATLSAWSLPEPIPTLATLGDLDPDVYDALAEGSREMGTAITAGEDFNPPDPQSAEFALSPTLPSGASEGGLRADQAQASTAAQPSDTKSGATAELSPA